LDVVPVADYVDIKSIAVPVSDYLAVYDYVPSMSPDNIRYRSLYTNVAVRTISVLDRIVPYESANAVKRSISVIDRVVPYESVWAGPAGVVSVRASDYLATDSAAVVRRSVYAYDIIVMRENVNIVRL